MTIGKDVILHKARISERKRRRKDNERRADADIRIIRELIDPLNGDFTGFDMEQARAVFDSLYALWNETQELDREIAKMEKELNG